MRAVAVVPQEVMASPVVVGRAVAAAAVLVMWREVLVVLVQQTLAAVAVQLPLSLITVPVAMAVPAS
jgi:hypothetical protein